MQNKKRLRQNFSVQKIQFFCERSGSIFLNVLLYRRNTFSGSLFYNVPKKKSLQEKTAKMKSFLSSNFPYVVIYLLNWRKVAPKKAFTFCSFEKMTQTQLFCTKIVFIVIVSDWFFFSVTYLFSSVFNLKVFGGFLCNSTTKIQLIDLLKIKVSFVS